MPLIFWNGKLLFDHGKLAMDLKCCCVGGACCGGIEALAAKYPVLCVALQDVIGCSCVVTVEFNITWDPGFKAWIGSPSLPGCSLLSATFKVGCSENPDKLPTDPTCMDMIMTITGGTCIPTPNPAFADPNCVCDPPAWDFAFDLTGLSCCNDFFDGHGSIIAHVTAGPC